MLPKGFCYLSNLDKSILQEIVYATEHNFMGRPIAGYKKEICIVSQALGEKLIEAQKKANKLGFTLKVYDSYRPLRAVEDIVFWAQDKNDQKMKAEFYAHINKADLFELEYVAIRSSHCTGCAVDLTLVPLPVPNQAKYQIEKDLKDGILPQNERYQDNSIDMGTSFDCFHELSHTMNPNINTTAKNNRKLLCDIMHSCGFENYEKEWWHFSLVDKPFSCFFDFEVE